MTETTTVQTDAHADHAMLIEFLQQRAAACPLCGYNLHKLESPRCPECGRELKLTIGMVQPYLSAWIALLIVACASGGFGLVCIIIPLKDGWPQWQHHYDLLNAAFIFHMLMVPTATLVMLLRRKLLRLARATQWTLFAAVLTVCFLMFTLFIVFEDG